MARIARSYPKPTPGTETPTHVHDLELAQDDLPPPAIIIVPLVLILIGTVVGAIWYLWSKLPG